MDMEIPQTFEELRESVAILRVGQRKHADLFFDKVTGYLQQRTYVSALEAQTLVDDMPTPEFQEELYLTALGVATSASIMPPPEQKPTFWQFLHPKPSTRLFSYNFSSEAKVHAQELRQTAKNFATTLYTNPVDHKENHAYIDILASGQFGEVPDSLQHFLPENQQRTMLITPETASQSIETALEEVAQNPQGVTAEQLLDLANQVTRHFTAERYSLQSVLELTDKLQQSYMAARRTPGPHLGLA